MEQADVLPVLSTPGSVLHNGTQAQAMEKLLLETVNKVFFLQQHCNMFSVHKGLRSELANSVRILHQYLHSKLAGTQMYCCLHRFLSKFLSISELLGQIMEIRCIFFTKNI